MDRQQVHETINRLVETYHDLLQAQERLARFSALNEPPRKPAVFPDLPAFLDFHEERRRYEDRLQSFRIEVEVLDEAHKEAERTLQDILPENVPLSYDYEGEHQELVGMWFRLVNQHLRGVQSRIVISSSYGPPSR